jgi:two-component system chemotaxis response regulator CheY
MAKLPDYLTNKNFLITDDYESMRVMITDNLRQLGVENIIAASSGNEAVTILKQHFGKPTQIDIVLTDLMMEDGNGIDLIKAIRGSAQLKQIPILMITSKSEVAHVIEAAKAGVSSYIIKPWNLEDLLKKIEDISEIYKV